MEINEETAEHQFVYNPTTGLILTITSTDKDVKYFHIGLEPPGETDIDAKFNVSIQ